MEMKLELVPVPVSDVDRAIAFYVGKLGFNLDIDHQINEDVRIVQLTPIGSACSIFIGKGIPEIDAMPRGSVKALHLVVADVVKAREMLVSQGIDVGEVIDHGRGVKSAGFQDPDGNSWLFQEMAWRSSEFKS